MILWLFLRWIFLSNTSLHSELRGKTFCLCSRKDSFKRWQKGIPHFVAEPLGCLTYQHIKTIETFFITLKKETATELWSTKTSMKKKEQPWMKGMIKPSELPLDCLTPWVHMLVRWVPLFLYFSCTLVTHSTEINKIKLEISKHLQRISVRNSVDGPLKMQTFTSKIICIFLEYPIIAQTLKALH